MNSTLASEGSGIVGRYSDEIEEIPVGRNRQAVTGSHNGKRAAQCRHAVDFGSRKDLGIVDLSAVRGKGVANRGDRVVGELQRPSASGEHDEDLVKAVSGRGEGHGMAVRRKNGPVHGLVPVADLDDFRGTTG